MSAISELQSRMVHAKNNITKLADGATGTEHFRLRGKAEGIELCLGYLDDIARATVSRTDTTEGAS